MVRCASIVGELVGWSGSLSEMGFGRRPRKGEVERVGEVAEERGKGCGMVTMGALAAVGVVAVKTGDGAVWESGGSWKVGLLKSGNGGRVIGESPS
jgi:hypothetical protein